MTITERLAEVLKPLGRFITVRLLGARELNFEEIDVVNIKKTSKTLEDLWALEKTGAFMIHTDTGPTSGIPKFLLERYVAETYPVALFSVALWQLGFSEGATKGEFLDLVSRIGFHNPPVDVLWEVNPNKLTHEHLCAIDGMEYSHEPLLLVISKGSHGRIIRFPGNDPNFKWPAHTRLLLRRE